MTIEPVMIF